MKYLGNKNRLERFLSDSINLENRESQIAIDLCSGTGTVSSLFRKNNIKVYSVDNLDFSYRRTKSIVEIVEDDFPNNELILEITNKKDKNIIYENYSDIVGVNIFKDYIAEHIDGNRIFIDSLLHKNKITPIQHNYLISILIEESDFRSNIMGSYASFYKKGWRKQALDPWSYKRNIDIPFSKIKGEAFKSNVIDFLENFEDNVDFIYMDPPYNHRQYIDNFHVLETISLYNLIDKKGKINKRVDINKKSNFCLKNKALSEFDIVFFKSSKISNEFYLSYSNQGTVNIIDLKNTMSKYFKNVEIFENKYRKFKTNSNTTDEKVSEYIIHGKNN